ncbi:unnamed protein product [Rotaria socialis]|uniref:Uncharacterized protein n=1 Tax=Rotaria socialis TaxID=392032 RepID=A0A818B928_9BILA|nr:unnamed protein product [Rotaria socialis]CAF4866453.1 unnamed protein product [Rotaria socialis]
MLILWQVEAVPRYPLNMCLTDSHQYVFFLLCFVSNDQHGHFQEYAPAHELISCCLWLPESSFLTQDSGFSYTWDSSFTFAQLSKKDIQSEQLVSWSASIDFAEQYEMFLSKILSLSVSFESKHVFYNCTSPWFGPRCCFSRDLPLDILLSGFANFIYQSKSKIEHYIKVTCDEHLKCHTILPLCLGWHEICDEKVDCLNGSDEFDCFQLEMNECLSTEYRCHNGQCIPIEFFHDLTTELECLDGTDESIGNQNFGNYRTDPSFHYEEHTFALGWYGFP